MVCDKTVWPLESHFLGSNPDPALLTYITEAKLLNFSVPQFFPL